jgi:predicted nuclease of predicted toxin-antitoxin system
MGVSLTTVEALRGANHDAVHLRDESLIRLPDPQIAAKAVAESRGVLTFDLDFGDILATAHSAAPSVVIFRLRNQTPAAVNPRLFRVIDARAAERASGAVAIVEDEGFRVRRLPIQPGSQAVGARPPLFEMPQAAYSS